MQLLNIRIPNTFSYNTWETVVSQYLQLQYMRDRTKIALLSLEESFLLASESLLETGYSCAQTLLPQPRPPLSPVFVSDISCERWLKISSLGYDGKKSCKILCCCLVTQSRLTFCDPIHCGPPGSSVQGILQARMLEWIAIPFSRGCFCPRDQTRVLFIFSVELIVLFCLVLNFIRLVTLLKSGEL